MATTRYKIAEQVLRIVNGGDPTEDSSIDIREVMLLVDQERDALIKSEIMDWHYTKSTATAKGELEINGGWISQATIPLIRDDSRNHALYGRLNFGYISLPNDAGIQKVETVDVRFEKQSDIYKVTGTLKGPHYNTGKVDLIFKFGPKVMDKKYSISFDFHLTKTIMQNGVTEQHQYAGIRKHKIEFNVDTSEYDTYENQHLDFMKCLVNSAGFKKFVKDFDIRYGLDWKQGEALTAEDNQMFDNPVQIMHSGAITLETKYGSRIDNFKINGVGDNGFDDGTDSEYGGAAINMNNEILNDIGFSWVIKNLGGSTNEQVDIVGHADSHGIGFMINDTMYTTEFVSRRRDVSYVDAIDKFVLENATKIAQEQNIRLQKETLGVVPDQVYTLNFQEIEPGGGYDLVPFTPGSAFTLEHYSTASANADASAVNFSPEIFYRMPSGSQHNSLYDKTVKRSGRQYYYIENLVNAGGSTNPIGGAAIYLYKRYSMDDKTNKYGNTIRVHYIGTSSLVEDHVTYPIPADYEKIIIKNLVELLTVMKNASDDMANDNID
tara:strand:+ start:2982 stop:4631 length:1650 start_codon:yes stop_codon:yes gene_type:complete